MKPVNQVAVILFYQEECARVLLFRGADKTVKNNFQEDAYQVAISSEHLNLADIIRCFRREDVGEFIIQLNC